MDYSVPQILYILRKLLAAGKWKDGARISGTGGEWKDLSSGIYYQIHLVPGQKCKRRSRGLPPNLPDTATTSQDGSYLKFITPIAGRKYYI